MFLRNNKQTGKIGEDIACNYLKQKGYEIVERNWHYSKNAEIDIIAKINDTLVFVEVKTRTSLNFGHPFESISSSKIKKIYSAILAYTSNSKIKYKSYRLDGIAITNPDNPEIEHIINIGQY